RPLGPRQAGEPRQLEPEHLLIKEEERRERLVLRRRGDVALGREPVEERGHLRRAHLRRMPPTMEPDEPADPVPVRLLGAHAVMARADRLAEASDQPLLPGVRRFFRTVSRIRLLSHFSLDNKPQRLPSTT